MHRESHTTAAVSKVCCATFGKSLVSVIFLSCKIKTIMLPGNVVSVRCDGVWESTLRNNEVLGKYKILCGSVSTVICYGSHHFLNSPRNIQPRSFQNVIF